MSICIYHVNTFVGSTFDIFFILSQEFFESPCTIVLILNILKNVTHFLTDTWHVCTYLNAFPMVVPKYCTEIKLFLAILCTLKTCRLITPAAWKGCRLLTPAAWKGLHFY